MNDLNNDSDQADYGVDIEDRVAFEILGELLWSDFPNGLASFSD